MKSSQTKGSGTAAFLIGLFVFVLIFSAAALLGMIAMGDYFSSESAGSAMNPEGEGPNGTIIIDAGHGGEDGGCSAGGILEKDLNLYVSKNVYDLCSFAGIDAEMTRTDDRLLYDMYGDLDNYKGKKKVYDLRNRVRFANEKDGNLFISIHMNKYPSESCRGTQIYYSPNDPGSKSFADSLQTAVRDNLQPYNTRSTKKAGSSIFVLERMKIPAVLVECGFLSNGDDLSELCDIGYRRDLSVCIFATAANYAGEGCR